MKRDDDLQIMHDSDYHIIAMTGLAGFWVMCAYTLLLFAIFSLTDIYKRSLRTAAKKIIDQYNGDSVPTLTELRDSKKYSVAFLRRISPYYLEIVFERNLPLRKYNLKRK